MTEKKKPTMKRYKNLLFGRAIPAGLLIGLQLFWIFAAVSQLITFFPVLNEIMRVLFHRAIATEIEDGFMVASDWGRGEFDSNTIRIEFSIDHDIKVGHEVPMEHCYFGYPCSSNIDYNTFTIKSGHVYLKSRTDDQIVVRFKNACFSLSADGDYLLNGDLSFSISQ